MVVTRNTEPTTVAIMTTFSELKLSTVVMEMASMSEHIIFHDFVVFLTYMHETITILIHLSVGYRLAYILIREY